MFNTLDTDPTNTQHSEAESTTAESKLRRLGLTDALLPHCQGGLARVVSAHRGRWLLAGHFPGIRNIGERGLDVDTTMAAASGRLIEREELPVTGDWVLLRSQEDLPSGSERLEVIDAILPRATRISREAAGGTGKGQLLAANVDIVLCVMAMGQNYNPNRLERYLSTAWESGALPVVVITKVDMEEPSDPVLQEITAIAQGIPCVLCSSVSGQGLAELRALLPPGKTAVMIGSSGAGKSTLLNALAGRLFMASGEISDAVGKGQHTTVSRELFALESGALMIDTPGMRELALDCEGAAVDATFSEVEALSVHCRFSDCSHSGEPGCAVMAAIEEGRIEGRRLKHWHKQRREIERQQALAHMAESKSRSRVRKGGTDWRRDLDTE